MAAEQRKEKVDEGRRPLVVVPKPKRSQSRPTPDLTPPPQPASQPETEPDEYYGKFDGGFTGSFANLDDFRGGTLPLSCSLLSYDTAA